MSRLLVLLGALGVGCTMLPERQAECGGAIAALSAQPGELRRRALYERRSGGSSVSLELVIERRGTNMVVLALSPFGAKAFAIRQAGGAVEVENFLGPALEIAARDVLRDLGHASYLGAAKPARRVRIENRACGYEAVLRLVDG